MGIKNFTMDGFLDDDAPVSYGFLGRQGGVSSGIYSALNCGPGSGDEAEAVAENRARAAAEVGAAAQDLLTLYQVHGNVCVTVDGHCDADNRPKADAHVTDKAGIALGVLSADCTPILFYGEKSDGAPVIGAAHAGWGGALSGVAVSAIDAMEALGAVRAGIRACVGPCIAQASYEVSDMFIVPFLAEDEGNHRFFMPSRNAGHLMFDLSGYNAAKIRAAGIGSVFTKGIDTYSNEDDFFSYRRTTHRNEGDYGRQISLIKIN